MAIPSMFGGLVQSTNYGFDTTNLEKLGYGAAGAVKISLSDLLQAPDAALMQIVQNVRSNALQYAVGATIFGIGAKVTRKILKGPINTVNRMIFTGKDAPLRGMGVRI
jgi:AICAR transformylase/IMP cyclohydrolase PurH